MLSKKKYRPSTEEETNKLKTRALEYGFDLEKYDLIYKTRKDFERISCYLNSIPVIYITKTGYLGVYDGGGKEEIYYKSPEDFKDAILMRLNYHEYKIRKVNIINEALDKLDISNLVIDKVYVKETNASSFTKKDLLPVFATIKFGEINTGIKIDMLKDQIFNKNSYLYISLNNLFSENKQHENKQRTVILNDTYATILRKKIKNYLNTNTCLHTSMQDTSIDYFSKQKFLLTFLKNYKNDEFFLPNSKIKAVLSKDEKLKCTISTMIFEYDTKTKNFKCTNEASIKKNIATIKKNNKKIKSILKYCNDFSINVSSKKITVKLINSSVKPEIKLSLNFIDEIDTNIIRKTMQEEIEKQELEKKKKEKLLINELKKYNVYESVLVEDIIYILLENDYALTENAIIKILKGSKGINHQIKKTKLFGIYSCLQEADISSVIKNMEKVNLLTQKTIKGSYGRFYAYQISEKGIAYMELPHKHTRKKNFNKFTDFDCRDFLKSFTQNPRICTENENEKQLSLLDNKVIVCKYKNLVKEFLKSKPESWKNYVETMYSLEDNGLPKKYWKMILNMFQETD